MDGYLQSIRHTAVAILDGGHAWDGGIFEVIGENHMIFQAVINKTGFDRKLLSDDAKQTLFSGGTLTALIFTVLLALILVIFACVSICNRCIASRRNNQFGQKVRLQVQRMDQHFPVPLRVLFALVCVILLLLSLIPLILTFATNSRLYASLAETAPDREGTVVFQLNRALERMDAFLGDIIPQIRVDVQPVVRRTLEMTAEMKAKSQKAYQSEFQDVTNATLLKSSSAELLDRMELFYDAGRRLRSDDRDLDIPIYDLSSVKFVSDNASCVQQGVSIETCTSHKLLVEAASLLVQSMAARWGRNGEVRNRTNTMRDFVTRLVGTLDGAGLPPERQKKMMEKKVRVSKEFAANISAVFDKELNSTAFVINSLNENLDKLETQIEGAREKLANVTTKLNSAYGGAAPGYDRKRFIATVFILLLLLLTLAYLSTASTIVLLLPNVASKRSSAIVSGVYASYFIYAVVLLFVFVLFGITSVLRTSTCRYMNEEPPPRGLSTIDRFLVPEINDVVQALKARAGADPNATDSIPLTAVGRLIGGIQDGCRKNLPILQALNAVQYIDTSISNSAEQSKQFKLKGRDILEREMMNANLSALHDKDLISKMGSLRATFLSYRSRNFSAYAELLDMQNVSSVIQQVQSLRRLNQEIIDKVGAGKLINGLQSNEESAANCLKNLPKLLMFVETYSPLMRRMEAKKDVVSIIDTIIRAATEMGRYLTNQRLWTEAAVKYYTKHVVDGSGEESAKISSSTTIGFLSALAKCRGLFDAYQSAVGVPCRSMLYPLSIIWFCLGWCVCFSILFSLFAHLSIVCFSGPPSTAPKHREMEEHRMEEKSKEEGAADNLLPSGDAKA